MTPTKIYFRLHRTCRYRSVIEIAHVIEIRRKRPESGVVGAAFYDKKVFAGFLFSERYFKPSVIVEINKRFRIHGSAFYGRCIISVPFVKDEIQSSDVIAPAGTAYANGCKRYNSFELYTVSVVRFDFDRSMRRCVRPIVKRLIRRC